MRIGIVNDSLMAREALRRAVASVAAHQVAWQAVDGREAVRMAIEDHPDLILMDLIMPGVDGVEATRQIMAQAPCPIVVVTATVSGHLSRAYEAISLGALDVVETPSLGPGGNMDGAAALLGKIATIDKLIGRATRTPAGLATAVALAPPGPGGARASGSSVSWNLIVLGASTGGPAAISAVLADLPDSPDSAVVIIQHVDAAFAPGLARTLGDQTGRRVDLVVAGDRPLPGRAYLAATNDHLVLDGSRQFRYVDEPRENYYRPSVDVFLASVARHWPEPGAAAILTGMGRDGAVGMLALRQAGWFTVAQDEATCVVYGMPRAAAEAGAAEFVLPIRAIGGAIAERVRDRSYRIPGAPRR